MAGLRSSACGGLQRRGYHTVAAKRRRVLHQATSDTIGIVGGCGHVGLPLGVKLANAGFRMTLVDINEHSIETVRSGRFPFLEKDGDSQLAVALDNGLVVTGDPKSLLGCDAVVFVVGTPVDEHLNPKVSDLTRVVEEYLPYLKENALIIMRSTLYPGTLEFLSELLQRSRPDLELSFCPERVAQGMALDEISSLPQIVASFTDSGYTRASEIFKKVAHSLIRLSPLEAEFAKLIANSWRYVEFAIANQFYMMTQRAGLDFFRVFEAIRHNYPRASGYKTPGFAAGPCLFKDTMQLSSFFDHQFNLGHAAMQVNEGLASFAVQQAEEQFPGGLRGKTVGLLGMTFKPNNDDIRESLSFRVKKLLHFRGSEVRWHDPYLEDSGQLEDVLACDCIILTTPHAEYRGLQLRQPFVDVWGVYQQTQLEITPGVPGGKP